MDPPLPPFSTLPFLPTATVYETFLTLAALLTTIVTIQLRGRMHRSIDRWKVAIRLTFSIITTTVGLIAMLTPNVSPNVNNTLIPLAFALSQCANLVITAIEYAWETRELPATVTSESRRRYGAEEYQRGLDAERREAAE